MGNFLTYELSFDWSNSAIDRNSSISDLSAAMNAAQELTVEEDKIYRTPNLFGLEFFNFLWTEGSSYDGFKTKYNWITAGAYQRLINIIGLIHIPTPQHANNVHDLGVEFPGENNGWIGFNSTCQQHLVFDIETWNEFHALYVSSFAFRSRRQNLPYITMFYAPRITGITEGQAKTLVKKRKSHPVFERIDTPTTVANTETLHGEQLQMHFVDGNVLNINGTWKHRVNNAEIPKRALEILEDWGFLLPIEYYT